MRHREALETGGATSQVTALSLLVSMYLQSVYAASSEEIEIFLSPVASRSRVREAVRGLSATRQIHSLSMDAQTYYFLENGLPEFAELATPSAPAEAEAPAGSTRAETQAEKDPGNGSRPDPRGSGPLLFRIGSHLPPDQARGRARSRVAETGPGGAQPHPACGQCGMATAGQTRLPGRPAWKPAGKPPAGGARWPKKDEGTRGGDQPRPASAARPSAPSARGGARPYANGAGAPSGPRKTSRWNPAKSTRRMERSRETRETQALGPAWEKVRLRFPSSARRRPWRCAVPPHAAPRPARDRPTRVAQRSSRVRHEASGAGGREQGTTAARSCSGPSSGRAPGRTPGRAPGTPSGMEQASQFPTGLNRRAPSKGAVGLLCGVAGPAVPGLPDLALHDAQGPASPRALTIPGPGIGRRPFPRPSRPGVRARPGPRPPSTGGTGQDTRPKPNPRGPYNERPRPAGYARPGGKPGPGGGGKGRSDRRREPGPRAALCPRIPASQVLAAGRRLFGKTREAQLPRAQAG